MAWRQERRAFGSSAPSDLGVLEGVQVPAQSQDHVQSRRETHGAVQKAFEPLPGRVDELGVYLRRAEGDHMAVRKRDTPSPLYLEEPEVILDFKLGREGGKDRAGTTAKTYELRHAKIHFQG